MKENEILEYIKKSFELKNQGYYKPAIEMLYKALAIDGDNIEIFAQLAHLYKLLGNYQRAVSYIEKVLEADKNHLECLSLLLEIYLSQGFTQLADNVAVKIYEIDSSSKNLSKRLNILNQLKNYDEIWDVEQSGAEFDDECYYELAVACYENYDFHKSAEMLKRGLERNNQNEKLKLLLAKIYYADNNFEESKKIFAELEAKSKNPEVSNYLGLFELEKNNFSKAADYFSKAVKIDGVNPEYTYNLASAYFLNGWLEEAFKYFNKAVCLEPENVNYHYSLAYLYYQQKEYDKASTELKFIKTIEQNHKLSNVLDALIIAKKGDLFSAKSVLENITAYEEDDFAYFALSEVYRELMMADAAEECIKKALSLCPDSIEYLKNLAEIKLGQKDYEEVKAVAEKIIEINDKYIYSYVILASSLYESGDYDYLFEIAQKMIEMDSNCPEGYYYNALALFNQGDKDFAIESLKKAISLDLNNACLYVKMSEFYQDIGDLKNAYGWAREASDIDERNYKYKWLCASIAAALKKNDEASKYYTQAYRLGASDKDLAREYSDYLKSIGKTKQAEKVIV